MTRADRGPFFEDFQRGQTLVHPTPRTVGDGDAALYVALTGDRRPLPRRRQRRAGARPAAARRCTTCSSSTSSSARPSGQVSLNAVANLGYADVRFLRAGLRRRHAARGLRGPRHARRPRAARTASSGCGRRGLNQRDEEVLRFYRWVMVDKRGAAPTGAADSPDPAARRCRRSELRARRARPSTRWSEPAWAAGARARAGTTTRSASASTTSTA